MDAGVTVCGTSGCHAPGNLGAPDPFPTRFPESEEVLKASNLGSPVTLNAPQSAPARAYADAVRRLKGETVAMTVPSEKRSLLGKLFPRRAA